MEDTSDHSAAVNSDKTTMRAVLPTGTKVALTVVILTGLALRVVYPGTTVFCEDQAHACALAEDVAGGEWVTGGLVNSGGFRNLPGFAYVLGAVWWVWPDALALLYFTGAVNVAAVVASGFLIRRWFGSSAAWWGVAFLAAAPWAIHYSRWIWAQHLLFPVALLVYLSVDRWLLRRSRWAAAGVILFLTLLVQIHLIGVVLALAIGLLLLWWRPRLPVWPIVIAVVIALASVIPYLLDGHLGAPGGSRRGYEHFWRVIPAAAMSLSGVGWGLEFRAGYSAFVDALSWRRWPYEVIMLLPLLLFATAFVIGIRYWWRQRREPREARRTPLSLVLLLVVAIPISFDVLGLRTSPTYLPVWYPLPFALMGWGVVRLTERGARSYRLSIASALIIVLFVQLAFFTEQLRYIHANGGVPGALIGRSYAGMKADIASVASRVGASEVWLDYGGPSAIQDEPAAYLFRHAEWGGTGPERVVIHFQWWNSRDDVSLSIEPLPEDREPPEGGYLVRPWSGLQQRGSIIPFRPQVTEP